MNKRFLVILAITSLIPFGCNKSIEKESSLIFTEFFSGENIQDRAVEITNISENTIDLSNYSICNYRNGSGLDDPTEIIKLSGQLESKKTYVVAFDEASDDLLKKADLTTKYLINDGTFSISLKYKDKYIVDTIGYVGFEMDIAKRSDLVRKTEYLIPRESRYVEYDWIRYPFDDLSHLGNLDCISEQDLLNGPKLTEENINTPFCIDNLSGTGGAMKVSLAYTIDGDTTKFNFGNEYSQFGISGYNSIRYFGINTPEIAHSYDEVSDPYGDEAKEFTNHNIDISKSFYVQSVKNDALFETYGRVLGYVWINKSSEDKLENYSLMSHLIVKNGYARVSFVDRNAHNFDDLKYKGVFYEEYLFNAQNYAKLHKLNIFCEGE